MTAIHLLFVTMLLCGLSSCKKSTSLAPGKAGPSSPPAASPAPTGFQLLKHGKEYRVMLADQLKDAAKVTVFLLDHNMQGASPNMFLIRPYDTYARVLSAKMYKASETADLLSELRVVLTTEGEFESPPEHFPFHGIRVFNRSDRVIFESSFAWKGPRTPASYSVVYPNGPGWAPISNEALEPLFRNFAPIPPDVWNTWEHWYDQGK